MVKYIFQRIALSIVTLAVIATLIFLMLRIIPGDPARVFAGETATAEDVERLRAQLNLDKPLYYQYYIFVKELSHGNLGESMRSHTPVLEEIMDRLPNTVKLAVIAIILATLFGVPIGVLAAVKRNSILDVVLSVGTLFGVAMPVYWLGLMLIVIFAVKLHWLPAAGNRDGIRSVIMPSFTLAAFSIALITRMTRSAVLEVLGKEFIVTARAKGLREVIVISKHVLRNALIPVVTVVALQFGNLLGGSILTETIFAWPGLGRLLTQSLFSRDYPMVQGLVIIFASLFILVNLFADILYVFIDPRIRYDS